MTSSFPMSGKEGVFKQGCGITGGPFMDGTHWWAQHIMDALSYWIERRDVMNTAPFMVESLCAGTGAEITGMKASICTRIVL